MLRLVSSLSKNYYFTRIEVKNRLSGQFYLKSDAIQELLTTEKDNFALKMLEVEVVEAYPLG